MCAGQYLAICEYNNIVSTIHPGDCFNTNGIAGCNLVGPANALSGWSDTSTCSASCGTGYLSQVRTCGGGCYGDCGGVALTQLASCSAGAAKIWFAKAGGGKNENKKNTKNTTNKQTNKQTSRVLTPTYFLIHCHQGRRGQTLDLAPHHVVPRLNKKRARVSAASAAAAVYRRKLSRAPPAQPVLGQRG